MGPQEKIKIIERADLGPVLARADHQENAIEVNGKAFYRLPPMVQEFVLCHEVCHLKHDEWDEGRTNQLASLLFLNRASTPEDRAERESFLSYLSDNGGYSNFAWTALISAAVSLGTSVYAAVRNSNAGWYSWDEASKQSNLNTMLRNAFEQSRRSSSQSAADFFWAQMKGCTNKDDSLDEFLARSKNAWVSPVIAKYEQQYGFKFDEVTPVDIKAFPLAMVAIGLVVGIAVYMIIKKLRK